LLAGCHVLVFGEPPGIGQHVQMAHHPAIVVVADAWGSRFGGINSFSTRLSCALGENLTEHHVLCACARPSAQDTTQAKASGVTLVGFDCEPRAFHDNSKSEAVVDAIAACHSGPVDFWLGHDRFTGPLALACAQRSGGARSAVVMHMSYTDYAYPKADPSESDKIRTRIEQQESVLRSADVGLAVGPLLHKRLVALRRSPSTSRMLIPGLLQRGGGTPPTDRLAAVALARFEQSDALVKQGPLVVAGFAKAFRDGHRTVPTLTNALLRLIGVPDEEANALRQIAATIAKRVVNLETHAFVTDPVRLRSLLTDSNVCLMPSWHEGFGLAGWEAIGSGIPLILSRNTGLFHLLDSLGGEVLGCVSPIDVHGRIDGEADASDIDAVAGALTDIATDIPKALGNATALRDQLRFKYGLTWATTAHQLAEALGLPTTITAIDVLTAPAQPSTHSADHSGRELQALRHLIEAARSNYERGNYPQGLELLASARRNPRLRDHPLQVLEAATVEAQILMRLNRYRPAVSLARRIADEARERQVWDLYVRAREVENVVLRDIGEYDKAIRLAREIVDVSTQHCQTLLASAIRSLARSLALGGLCDEAVRHAQESLAAAKSSADRPAEAKAALALGEALRHGRDDDGAIRWYELSREISRRAGHTDCYLWASLGLADAKFLKLDWGGSALALEELATFLNGRSDVHPLETLHQRLSSESLLIMNDTTDRAAVAELLDSYSTLGIEWPREYVKALSGTPRRIVPRRL